MIRCPACGFGAVAQDGRVRCQLPSCRNYAGQQPTRGVPRFVPADKPKVIPAEGRSKLES